MAPLIRVIGSLNADMVSVTPRFPEAGETLTALSFGTSAGGKGANQAVACGRLSRPRRSHNNQQQQQQQQSSDPAATAAGGGGGGDVKVEIIGAIGDLDAYFPTLLQPTLETSGVDTSRVRTIKDAHTGVAVIIVDNSAGGENRILFSPGANYSGMRPEPDVLGLGLAAPVPDVVVLQAEIPVESVVGILRGVLEARREGRVREGEVEVIFNPAPAPPGGLPEEVYPAIDHLVMNETECGIMGGKAGMGKGEGEEEKKKEVVAGYFHNLGVRYVLVTLGAKGVWFSAGDPEKGDKEEEDEDEEERYRGQIPAAKVERVVDTTAAGDTFVGGYAVQIARWREERRKSGKGVSVVGMGREEKEERYGRVTEEAVRWGTRDRWGCRTSGGAPRPPRRSTAAPPPRDRPGPDPPARHPPHRSSGPRRHGPQRNPDRAPFSPLWLLRRTGGETFDDVPLEEQEHDDQRKRGQQRSGEQDAVLRLERTEQRGGPQIHDEHVFVGRDDERPEEVVPIRQEGDGAGDSEPGTYERNDDAPPQTELTDPVHPGGVEQLVGNADRVLPHQEDREGVGSHREDQRPVGVEAAELTDDLELRHQQHLERNQNRPENEHEQQVLAPELVLREGEPGK